MTVPSTTRLSDPSQAPNPAVTNMTSGLIKCGSIEEFRAAAPLPKDAQEAVDNTVIQVGLERLVIVQDLIAEGLTYPLSNWLSVLELYWEKISKAGHAVRTMTPGTRGENQLQDRSGERIPIYATIDDFMFNIRILLAAERNGAPLDTSMVSQATRRVNESIEDAAINGAGIQIGGNSVPGLLNAPNAATQAYVDNEAWTAAGHSGEDILTDVLNFIDALQANKKYGPYNLYVPTLYGTKLVEDFKANSDKTIQQRLEEIVVGGRPLRIRVADQLPANRTALVQMTNDVVDVVMGQEPAPISWEDGPGWNRMFAVLACIVCRFKDDYDGNSGVCLGNTS